MRREYPMTWLPLDSKMFLSMAYDAGKRTLYLRFQSEDVYRYFEFSNDDYQHFLSAESKGRYFLSNIRNCFRYERLAKLQVA
jgi:KTSC domain